MTETTTRQPTKAEINVVAAQICYHFGDPDNCRDQYLDLARCAIAAIDTYRSIRR